MTDSAKAPTLAQQFETAARQHLAGEHAAAEAGYRKVLAQAPRVWDVRNNLVSLLRRQGRWAEAEALLREALAFEPDNADLQFRLALYALADGRYAEGWPQYEWRRRSPEAAVRLPALSIPEWNGGPARTLLVCPEQGLGDQIMFARYVPLLQQRGIEAAVIAPQPLARLFENAGLPTAPLAGGVLPVMEAWTPLGSLPLRFGTTLDTVPPPLPVRGTGRRPAGGIGVMTAGGARHINDADRSMPPEAAAELLALPGARNLSLEATAAGDMQDTADLIAGLDLVITVDTAVAHLAGSLGKPTWILLPFVRTDWRWLRAGASSPWYPSARLFRQPAPGDWAGVLAQVRAALAEQRG